MASFADGLIHAFCGPMELGAPDALEDEIVGFIGAAEHTLLVAVQEIDNRAIAQALLEAVWRGVDVEVFLEQDYLRAKERGRPRAGESPQQTAERLAWGADGSELAVNRQILSALLRSGVEVHSDLNPAIFHQKFVVRDVSSRRRGGRPALLTGSANFTDCHRNLNHVVVFEHRGIAEEYARQFQTLRTGQFGRGVMGDVPKTHDLGGVPVKVLFAPDHAPELELVKQMLKVKDLSGAIRFAIFTFSGSSAVDDALLTLARAGVKIRGALDRGQGMAQWSAARGLNHPNITLVAPGAASGVRKLHHKLMVIDASTVIAGSFNYTAPANDYNDENLFVLGSPHDEADGHPVNHARCSELAAFFTAEIERIISNSEPLDIDA